MLKFLPLRTGPASNNCNPEVHPDPAEARSRKIGLRVPAQHFAYPNPLRFFQRSSDFFSEGYPLCALNLHMPSCSHPPIDRPEHVAADQLADFSLHSQHLHPELQPPINDTAARYFSTLDHNSFTLIMHFALAKI